MVSAQYLTNNLSSLRNAEFAIYIIFRNDVT